VEEEGTIVVVLISIDIGCFFIIDTEEMEDGYV
jgi:hypothetical protein